MNAPRSRSSESRRFDRAAPFYDRSRGLPPDTAAAVTELLQGHVWDRDRVLEIGVGTGRIALPLHGTSVEMFGIDLSRPMLDVLVEKAGGRAPFPLAVADATRLPFPADSFDGALAAHVFHLIPNWETAVGELVRVLRPGAVCLSSRGGLCAGSLLPEVRQHFERAAGDGARHVGLSTAATGDLDATMASHGAAATELPTIEFSFERTVGTMIDELEAGYWSSTWSVPDEVVREAATATREWAERELGPLGEVRTIATTIRWTRYDLP